MSNNTDQDTKPPTSGRGEGPAVSDPQIAAMFSAISDQTMNLAHHREKLLGHAKLSVERLTTQLWCEPQNETSDDPVKRVLTEVGVETVKTLSLCILELCKESARKKEEGGVFSPKTPEKYDLSTAASCESLPVSTEIQCKEERDNLTPEAAAAQCFITSKPAIDEDDKDDEADEDADESTVDKCHGWNKAWCRYAVTVLIRKIIDFRSIKTHHAIKGLTEMLWVKIADCDTAVQPSFGHIERACEAVKRDLYKRLVGMWGVKLLLAIACEDMVSFVIDSLKDYLIGPEEKTGIKGSFKSVLKK